MTSSMHNDLDRGQEMDPLVQDSAARRSLRVHVERIERLAGRHEQPVSPSPTEAKVGASLGQRDMTDGLAGRGEYAHPVQRGLAHAPPAPEITVDIAAEPVRRAGTGVDQDAAAGELGS